VSDKGLILKTKPIEKEIDSVEWAYLAGFYDGEGTVTATRQSRKNRWYYQLRFVINNTNYLLLEKLQKRFGGSVHSISKIKNRPNWKRSYAWYATSKETCLPIFYGMLPYLRYKNEEINLAIEYWESMITPDPGKSLSDEEIYRRYRIIRSIKSLPNRRGSMNGKRGG